MPKPPSVRVLLCCNDHRNGMFQRFVEGIEVGDRGEDLHIALDGYCRMSVATSHVYIGRFKYPVRHYQEWVGNWCWYTIFAAPDQAARLLNNLRSSGRWSPHERQSWIWDLWKSGESFTARHFVEAERLAEEWERANGVT